MTLGTFTKNRSRAPNWASKAHYPRGAERRPRAGTKYVLATGRAEVFLKATTKGKKSPQVEEMEVEFAMQEGFLVDSFYLDSGVLLTCIYFLITQDWVINLSLDSACQPNEWIRI